MDKGPPTTPVFSQLHIPKSDDDANVELELAELNNAIEEMLEVMDSKRSKVTTTVNVAGACESKENVLECIANFLTCWQCN